MQREPGLVIDIRPGECLALSGPARITLLHKSGRTARLHVAASKEVRIVKSPAQGQASGDANMAMCSPS